MSAATILATFVRVIRVCLERRRQRFELARLAREGFNFNDFGISYEAAQRCVTMDMPPNESDFNQITSTLSSRRGQARTGLVPAIYRRT